MNPRLSFTLAALLLLASCAAPISPPTGPGPVGQPRGEWREQAHWIPVREASGSTRLIYTNVCRPAAGNVPARVLVLNHGTGPDRVIHRAYPCDAEFVEWFLRRGFMVVSPVRRGYGATGGPWAEDLAVGPHGVRNCNGVDPYKQALETGRDIDAAVEYGTSLPGAKPDGAVVVGISTGGYGTIAYDSMPHPKAAAFINVSGGRGGGVEGGIGRVCHADRLIEGAARYGRTAGTPMLWLYATNDFYFSPDLGRAMHRAFTQAGGKAEFVEIGLFGYDGHAMFGSFGGTQRWGPIVEAYLRRQLGG